MSRVAFSVVDGTEDGGDLARSLIDIYAGPPDQNRLLHSILDHFPDGEPSPYVDIPLLVYGGITGHKEGALSLTALGKFFFLGMDIIDDIADGDVKDHWPNHTLSDLHLGSSLLLSALPQILIANLNAPGAIRTRIHQRFAKGLFEAAAGQQAELRMTEKSDIHPEEVEDSVKAKSSGVATLAAIAALFAGATENEVSAYEETVRNLGIAAQLATDFHDLFQAPASRDLRNGTRTLPIALCLQKCSGTERKILFGSLEEARSLLFSKGIGRLTAFIIELYCERAREGLNSANPKAIYRKAFNAYIDRISLFQKRGESWATNRSAN